MHVIQVIGLLALITASILVEAIPFFPSTSSSKPSKQFTRLSAQTTKYIQHASLMSQFTHSIIAATNENRLGHSPVIRAFSALQSQIRDEFDPRMSGKRRQSKDQFMWCLEKVRQDEVMRDAEEHQWKSERWEYDADRVMKRLEQMYVEASPKKKLWFVRSGNGHNDGTMNRFMREIIERFVALIDREYGRINERLEMRIDEAIATYRKHERALNK